MHKCKIKKVEKSAFLIFYLRKEENNEYRTQKNFKSIFNKLSVIYGSYSVFYDFVKMAAISINNAINKNEILEKEYLSTINKYKKEAQELFPKMLGELVMIYDKSDEITDFLGQFFEEQHLGNNKLGQFFTPTHISDVMAELVISNEDLKKIINEKGFITMQEPTCGAGGMILSFARKLKKENINYQKHLFVEAIDISDICTYMAYIQLSLYGIPGIVYCGDSLSLKMKFNLQTPLYQLFYWKFCSLNKEEKESNQIINNEPKKEKIFKEIMIKGNRQISLF